MLQLPSEDKLKRYLLKVSEIDALPPYAQLEPGALLYAVKEIWSRDQDRDGRKGHISETEIASEIARLTNRKYTRNHYQTMFGPGRKSQKEKTEVPQDVAEAFLNVAFKKWSFGYTDENLNGFKSIFPEKNESELKYIIKLVCDQIYKQNTPVRCQPQTGLGPLGFMHECRINDRSVVVAAEAEHIITDLPVTTLKHWIENITMYFKDVDLDDSPIKLIWAFREPLISNDLRLIGNLHNLSFLRTALLVARAYSLNQHKLPSWEKLSKKCIVVILLNRENDKFRAEKNNYNYPQASPISDHFIFPREMPWEWRSVDTQFRSMSELQFIVSIENKPDINHAVNYHVVQQKKNGIAPVAEKNSPSRESDESFKNLYLACLQYVQQEQNTKMEELLKAAQGHGWKFMTADEFLNFRVP